MSENVNILKCECLMSKDEEEIYDVLVSNGRFVCLDAIHHEILCENCF